MNTSCHEVSYIQLMPLPLHIKSRNSLRKKWEIKPLLSGHGHRLAVPTRVLSLRASNATLRLA